MVDLDNNPKTSQFLGMKEKKLTITSKNITQKQWSILLLELNLIKQAWAPYAKLELHAPGLKKILTYGTKMYDEKDRPSR